jgi:hypothetical protein
MRPPMLIQKRDVLALLDRMPDELDGEELMYHIYVLEKIAEGEADIAAGRVVPHDDVKREIDAWLRSSGPKAR